MAGSIGDWYVNASGRRDGGLGYDAENDDPVDRGIDTWLDDLHAPRTPESRRAPRARAPQPHDSPTVDDRPIGTGRIVVRRNTDGATAAELARAAQVLRAQQPGISTKALTRWLRRQLGWPSLAPAQVAEALGKKPSADLAQEARAIKATHPGIGLKKLAARLRQRGWADATAESVQAALQRNWASKPGVPTPPSTKPAMSASAMARKIRSIDASAPGWTIPALTKAIRAHGWSQATEADVRKALVGLDDLRPKPDSAPYSRRGTTAAVAPKAKVGKADRGRADRAAAGRDARVRAIVAGVRGGSRPDPASLKVAILVFEQVAPRASIGEVHALLHRCGWPGLKLIHVEALVEEFAVRASPNSPAVLAAVENRRVTRAAAVRAIRAVSPGDTAEMIASRLRGWGWTLVTKPQIQDILERIRLPAQSQPRAGKAAANSQKPPRTLRAGEAPTTPPNMIGPQRTLDIVERPNARTCPGCGRVISSLGICGCS